MTATPLVLRPATSADTAELERLAALDSARPLQGEVLLAYAARRSRSRAAASWPIRSGPAPSSSSCCARPRATVRGAACAAAWCAPHSRSHPRGGYGSRR